MRNPAPFFACLAAVTLVSCVPKAIPVATVIVQEGKSQAKPGRDTRMVTRVQMPRASVDPVPAVAEKKPRSPGGLRLPDMLTLPDDGELRSSDSNVPKNQGGGAVTARPPTDPPSRPKPPTE